MFNNIVWEFFNSPKGNLAALSVHPALSYAMQRLTGITLPFPICRSIRYIGVIKSVLKPVIPLQQNWNNQKPKNLVISLTQALRDEVHVNKAIILQGQKIEDIFDRWPECKIIDCIE